jgi:hypothetical protein
MDPSRFILCTSNQTLFSSFIRLCGLLRWIMHWDGQCLCFISSLFISTTPETMTCRRPLSSQSTKLWQCRRFYYNKTQIFFTSRLIYTINIEQQSQLLNINFVVFLWILCVFSGKLREHEKKWKKRRMKQKGINHFIFAIAIALDKI